MAGRGDKTDMTVQLPDEVLCHIFSFLSLKDKLRSEAVNHKFQRCILQELSTKPRPLEIRQGLMNGCYVPQKRLLGAVQTLATKAKFSSIEISLRHMPDCVQRMDAVLSLLISEAQCLTKVTSFGIGTNCGGSQEVFGNFLDGCDKLSAVRFLFDIRHPNTEPHGNSIPLDLGHLFKNRRLTELQLCPAIYPMADLAEMFKQIQPNALRKLDLWFDRLDAINIAELIDALAPNGSVLEQLHLVLRHVDVQFAPLFEALARFPALRKCNIECIYLDGSNVVAQFAAAVTSMFNMGHIDISVTLDENSLKNNLYARLPTGCQFVNLIRQIQRVHPSMAIDIDPIHSLTLSLGNASIRINWYMEGIEACGDENCVLCCTFYPSMLSLLRSRAQAAWYYVAEEAHHLDWQVDRCKLEKVVEDLNNWTFEPTGGENPKLWRALSLEETDEQQSITIHFETDEEMVEHPLFSITVSCGQCLTHGCVKCVD